MRASNPDPRTRIKKAAFLAALLVVAVQLWSQQPAGRTVDYRRDIQPILTNNCVKCHAGNAAPAEFRLDTPEAVLHGGTSGAAVVPGKADESQLVVRMEDSNANNRMPPPPNAAVSAQDIAVIKAWINQGAKIGDASVDFVTQVQPIFKSACYSCHSGSEVKGGLHLDARAEALKGGALGHDIVPGKSQDSLLLHRVLGDNGLARMPMAATPLNPQQIATLRTWIDQGANWPDAAAAPKHWAYQKPVRPTLPAVKDAAWVKNPIDRFVLAKLDEKGLKPSQEASRETLARRLYLDTIGLPPSPAQVDEFVNDKSPDAYERLVDKLLADAHFGERWGNKWLDLARYGDSDGYEKDRQRPGAYPYRDWVIKAFNADMPFDQFTIEQLAGDLLTAPFKKNWTPQEANDPKVATGFVRSSMLNTEGGTDPEEQNWIAQTDRATTVGNVWLGSTTQCTQCHNHKYDPFTQKQFYQMVAFFNNAKFGGQVFVDPNDPDPAAAAPGRRNFNEGTLDLPTPEQAKARDALRAELRTWQAKLNAVTPEFQKAESAWEQAVLESEKSWQPLRPTRLQSTGGSTLTLRPDASILASGKNPDLDTYVLDAKSPVNGQITGIRVEALPDASLPQGGPGRDFYGNFQMNTVTVEYGPSAQKLSKVSYKDAASDDMVTRLQNADQKVEQIWRVDATRDGQRMRRQLVIIPEKPFTVTTNDTLRVSLVQLSEYLGVAIGNFRVSVTTSPEPTKVVDVPFNLHKNLGNRAAAQPAAPPETAPPARRGRGGAPAEDPLIAHWRTVAPELADVRAKIAGLNQQIVALQIPSTPVLSENTQVKQPTTFVRERGAFVSKAEEVKADVPSFLGALPADAPANRLGLAEWLVTGDNPLPARVRVNQMWETVFGLGIVETAEDFGTQGFPPSHAELLDWLATEFQEKGWDQKAIIRLMLTSNTYRQSSKVTPELLEMDPKNALLARGPRFRVEAETIRDIALSASGLINLKMFGPPVMPRQPEGLWIFPYQPATDHWIESKGDDRYRRAMYIFIRRTVRYPSLTVFDAPSRENTTVRRSMSDTPLQALTALNDPTFFEAAQAMAKRIEKEGGADAASRATYGFRLATSRKPDAREMKTLLASFERDKQYFARNLKEAESVTGVKDAELAAWTSLSNALLNLDETLTKE
jgi:mono/diheme cytochrome c family protein